ncbi:hypothetical protein Thermus77412_02720 [Thermus antranikianii]
MARMGVGPGQQAVAACLLLVAWIVGVPAWAHSALERSIPADGDVLTKPPRQLELFFATPVYLTQGGLTLKDQQGTVHPTLLGAPVAAEGGRRYIIPLRETLPDGTYTLTLRALARDGDPLTAELRFAVRELPAAPRTPTTFGLAASEPADGTLLPSPPSRVVLRFTQPVQRVLGALVLDDRQQPVAGENAHVDPADPTVLVIPLDRPLRAGSYKVIAYVFAADGVPANPVLYFAVERVTPFPPPAPVPFAWTGVLALPETWLRALMLSTLLVLAGGSAFVAWWAPPSGAKGRWRVVVRATAVLGILAAAGLLTLRAHSLGGSILELLRLPVGGIPLLQAALMMASAAVSQERVRAGAAALALALHPLTGHPALPGVGGPATLATAVLHLLAAATWLGGVVALLALCPRHEPADWLRIAAQRFAPFALLALIVLVGTGLGLAADLSGSWQGFWASDWGRVVRIKAAVLLAIAFLGAAQRRRVARRSALGTSFLARLWLELGLGLSAVLLGTALGTLNPVAGVFPTRIVQNGITARLTVWPLAVGHNMLTVRLEPDPAARRVTLRFFMPPDFRMESTAFHVGPGTYAVVGNQLHGPGRIDVTVRVEQADGTVLAFPFRVEVPLPGR